MGSKTNEDGVNPQPLSFGTEADTHLRDPKPLPMGRVTSLEGHNPRIGFGDERTAKQIERIQRVYLDWADTNRNVFPRGKGRFKPPTIVRTEVPVSRRQPIKDDTGRIVATVESEHPGSPQDSIRIDDDRLYPQDLSAHKGKILQQLRDHVHRMYSDQRLEVPKVEVVQDNNDPDLMHITMTFEPAISGKADVRILHHGENHEWEPAPDYVFGDTDFEAEKNPPVDETPVLKMALKTRKEVKPYETAVYYGAPCPHCGQELDSNRDKEKGHFFCCFCGWDQEATGTRVEWGV